MRWMAPARSTHRWGFIGSPSGTLPELAGGPMEGWRTSVHVDGRLGFISCLQNGGDICGAYVVTSSRADSHSAPADGADSRLSFPRTGACGTNTVPGAGRSDGMAPFTALLQAWFRMPSTASRGNSSSRTPKEPGADPQGRGHVWYPHPAPRRPRDGPRDRSPAQVCVLGAGRESGFRTGGWQG